MTRFRVYVNPEWRDTPSRKSIRIQNSPLIFLHCYGLREMVRLTNDGLLSARTFFEIGKGTREM